MYKVHREPCIVSVPSSELGPPPPLPQVSVLPGIKGGTLVCGGGGGGVPIRTTGEKALHSVYFVDLWNVVTNNISGVDLL